STWTSGPAAPGASSGSRGWRGRGRGRRGRILRNARERNSPRRRRGESPPTPPRRHAPMNILKVAAKSNPTAVAGALAGVVREKGTAELQAIGAAAINQAVKAIAIARGYVAPSGLDLVCVPAFADVQIDGEDRTAIKLIVSPR